MSIQVRSLTPEDHEMVIELTKRLSEFELLEWRQAARIEKTNITLVENAMEEDDPENVIYIAEAERKVIGYIRIQTQTDYFSGEKHGYVANLAVENKFEGQGVGRMLLETAEQWTREKGYAYLRLHVFKENQRALQIYEKYGYQQDIISYVKVLASKPEKCANQ